MLSRPVGVAKTEEVVQERIFIARSVETGFVKTWTCKKWRFKSNNRKKCEYVKMLLNRNDGRSRHMSHD